MRAARKSSSNGKSRESRTPRRSALKRKGFNGQKIRAFFLRSWWVLRGAAGGILVLALLYGAYLGVERMIASPYLGVKDIQVSGCVRVDPKDLVSFSGVHAGDPLVKVDLDDVRERLLSHPVVKDVSVARELPDTLRIHVVERTPAAALFDGAFLILDSEGVVLSRREVFAGDLPVITGIKGVLEPGDAAGEAEGALEAIEKMTSMGFPERERISEVRVSGQRILVFLTGSGTMLVLPRQDISGALGRLTRFVRSKGFDAAAPGYDLRFDGRVVALPDSSEKKDSKNKNTFAGG